MAKFKSKSSNSNSNSKGNARTSTNHQNRNSTSIVEKLSMLRSFVANDAFSETDLSTCLRQAAYNVELAAERLMTGQYKCQYQHQQEPPTKRQKMVVEKSMPSPQIPSTTTTISSAGNNNVRKPAPVTPKTPSTSPSSVILSHSSACKFDAVTANADTSTKRSTATSLPTTTTATTSSSSLFENSWLLCHRWISNGICLQRNGCVAYQEHLQVEHTFSSSTIKTSKTTSMVRFRGNHILGQFPKHLSQLLGPLLERKLVQVKAQALMEERFLPTGADVAFAIWIYLPDPVEFLALLDPSSDTNQQHSNSSKLFFSSISKSKGNTSSSSTNANTTGRSLFQQAAFGLLQWAQHGETFDFESTSSSSSPSLDTTAVSSTNGDELLVEDNEHYNPEDAERHTEEEYSDLTKDLSNVAQLQELDYAPTDGSFQVTLRPYQKQALWWMTQREQQNELEESSRQQLQLLEELVQSTSTSSSLSSSSLEITTSSVKADHKKTSIHCECGPVQTDKTSISAPSVMDVLHPSATAANPNLKHPLWERRFLCDPSKTKAMSFYVQPLFGAAMATPPPPPKPCRGGILADSMGLGKTIMLLALIQSSLDPKTRKDASSTTLIVSPLSLLAQWQEEIESKTSLTYHVHYGDKKQSAFDFDSVDVVLTTYGSLQGEWVAHSKADREVPPSTTGLLGHLWKRVILDEAHCVKNTATVASRACCLLQAERRWCISGTIIQNSLDDVYALLKFLRHEPWCQPSFWKAAISTKLRSSGDDHLQQKQEALDRVRRLLTPIMLRRTKDSVDKDGKPILTLPPVETKIIPVELSPAERQFYDALHRKSLSLFEGFIQAGTASKSWLAIFSLLHRLRQTCDHVALTIKAHMDDDEWASNIAQVKEEEKKAKSSTDVIDQNFLDDLMGKFRAMQSSGRKDKKGCCQDSEDASYAAKIAQMLNEAAQNKSALLKEECSICLEPINIHDSVVTPCFHIFCKECLVGVLRQQGMSQNVDDSNKPSAMIRLPNGPCPVCNEPIDASKILRLSESEGHIQTNYLLNSMIAPKAVAAREEDGAARQTLETAVQGSTSSKLSAILNELHSVWNEDPGSKVLIFSQFLGFLDLMEESFKGNQIPFARLDGKLNLKERMAILQEFGSDQGEKQRISTPSAKKNVGSVLLISMKAGGVGLNLVSARTVFITDRWWNASVEDQCVDRIHRIGQTATKVRVCKFYVTNSVEERIVELQKRKKNVASQALCDKENGDSEAQNGSRPTLEDFRILFH